MNKLQLNKIVSFLILISLLLAAFALPQQVAVAKSDLVRFTFVNKSDHLASLRLYGNDQFYYFLLRPGETKVYTPVRGEYKMTFFSCGQYINKELDLTKQYTLVVPSCGTYAFTGKKLPPGKIDGGEIIKLVRVTIENDTDKYMKLILTGPATYVFTFGKDEAKVYTISKGEYDYTMYGCGSTYTGTVTAHAHKTMRFRCPQ